MRADLLHHAITGTAGGGPASAGAAAERVDPGDLDATAGAADAGRPVPPADAARPAAWAERSAPAPLAQLTPEARTNEGLRRAFRGIGVVAGAGEAVGSASERWRDWRPGVEVPGNPSASVAPARSGGEARAPRSPATDGPPWAGGPTAPPAPGGGSSNPAGTATVSPADPTATPSPASGASSARGAAKALASAAKAVFAALLDAAEAIGAAVLSVATGAGNAVWNLFKGLGDGFVGFFRNLLSGRVGDAFEAMARGIDRGLLLAPARLAQGLFAAVADLGDAAGALLGPLGAPVRWLGRAAADIGRTAVETAVGVARSAVRAPLEAAGRFLSRTGEAALGLLRGEPGKAAEAFGRAFADMGGELLGSAFDIAAQLLAGAASAIGTAIGLESSRALTDDEKRALGPMYGDALDLDLVRVKRGGAVSLGAARTVGNTVYLPASDFDASGTLTPWGQETLFHELGHVWQNQNGGPHYIHAALWSQLLSTLRGGDRNGAYDWTAAMRAGTSFSAFNPEQQAELIGNVSRFLAGGGKLVPGTVLNGAVLSASDIGFIEDADAQIRAGSHAP